MTERANDEILQLAGQGNVQALSVYLNRHLIPNGAHVKVKQKEDALHVLIVVMRESENSTLVANVEQLLTQLHPEHIKRVRLYTQVLGQKQSTLRQQFSLAIAPSNTRSHPEQPFVTPVPTPQAQVEQRSLVAPKNANNVTNHSGPSHPAPVSAPHPGHSPQGSPPSNPSPLNPGTRHTPPPATRTRYSVAEFLSRATSLEELKVLYHHPFFTGVCPQCGTSFHIVESPPIYWDCPHCQWKDDLSAALAPEKVWYGGQQPSLTESKRLGDYLVEAGLLTHGQIEVALQDQLNSDLKFGEVLVRRGWIKEETIEYLMQKVILPERMGLYQNASSYLESSRNLLKALFQDYMHEHPLPRVTAGVKEPVSPSLNAQAPGQVNGQPPEPAISTVDSPPPLAPSPQRVMQPNVGKLANERETLILPDLDISEYLKGQ